MRPSYLSTSHHLALLCLAAQSLASPAETEIGPDAAFQDIHHRNTPRQLFSRETLLARSASDTLGSMDPGPRAGVITGIVVGIILIVVVSIWLCCWPCCFGKGKANVKDPKRFSHHESTTGTQGDNETTAWDDRNVENGAVGAEQQRQHGQQEQSPSEVEAMTPKEPPPAYHELK